MLGFAAKSVEQSAQAQGGEGHGLSSSGTAGVQPQIEGRDGGGGDLPAAAGIRRYGNYSGCGAVKYGNVQSHNL